MQVTWVEHVEVDDRSVHNLYKPLVNSGLAFGAKRWVGTLDRQCERLASAMASNIPNGDLGGTHKSLLDIKYAVNNFNRYIIMI
jgi:homeobox-leucine zipper protein